VSRAPRRPATTLAVLAALITVGAVVGGLAGLVPGAPSALTDSAAHAATPAPTSSASPQRFDITLDELAPKVLRPDDTLSLSGSMVNTSGETLTSVSYALRISTQRITTRYQLAKDADRDTTFGVVLSSTRQPAGDEGRIDPGQRFSWQLSLPIDRVSMPTSPDQFGAFPIAIEVTSHGESGTERTRLSTTVLWMPKGAQFKPTKVSWLWPVIDGVHRGLGNTFTDDSLAADLAPTGRLGKLVNTAAESKVPLTYVVDPALVDDAAAMASTAPPAGEPAPPASEPAPPAGGPTAAPSSGKSDAQKSTATATRPGTAKPDATKSGAIASPEATPYQVGDGKHTRDGVGAATAAAWLDRLRATVTSAGSALVATPYGDADLVALERAGLDKEMAIARSTGQSMLSDHLALPTLPDLVWPVDGRIDDATLDDLATDLTTTVVLNGRALQPQDPNALAGPRADLQTPSGAVRALLTDPTIDDLVADPGSVSGGARAAEQRFLAETMLITEQRPGSGSSLVVAPPRHLDADAYLAALLSDTAAVPWLEPVNASVIAAQPPDDVARQQLAYPPSARNAELPTRVLSAITPLRDGLAAFNSILSPTTTDPFIAQANEALLRAESSSWREHPQRAVAIIDAVRAQLQSRTSKVFISKPGLITLTSRKQKIPLTVVNELPEPVTVQVNLHAVNAARLTVTPIPPFTVEGKGSRHEVVIEVEATTGGRFEVEAQLTTADNQTIGQPVSFELNSTAYGAVALAIAGGAAGLLFLLSGIRIYRRVRQRRNGPPGADAGDHVDTPTSPTTPTAPRTPAPPAQPVP
jgi:hypothetical protein